MKCEHIEPKLAIYAQGELPGSESRAVESHLSECPVCRALFQDMKSTLDLLGSALAGSVQDLPSRLEEGCHERILSRVAAGRAGRNSWLFRPHPALAVAASLVVVAGLSWLVVVNVRPLRRSMEPDASPQSAELISTAVPKSPPPAAPSPSPKPKLMRSSTPNLPEPPADNAPLGIVGSVTPAGRDELQEAPEGSALTLGGDDKDMDFRLEQSVADREAADSVSGDRVSRDEELSSSRVDEVLNMVPSRSMKRAAALSRGAGDVAKALGEANSPLSMRSEHASSPFTPGKHLVRVTLSAGPEARSDLSLHIAFDAGDVSGVRLLGDKEPSQTTADSVRVEFGDLAAGEEVSVLCEATLAPATGKSAGTGFAVVTVAYESGGVVFADRHMLSTSETKSRFADAPDSLRAAAIEAELNEILKTRPPDGRQRLDAVKRALGEVTSAGAQERVRELQARVEAAEVSWGEP